MKLKEDSSAQKLRGAYYTPLPLAEMMVKLFSKDKSIKNVLEPSCGDGVFLDALWSVSRYEDLESVTAIEIDEDESHKLITKWKDTAEIQIKNQDFFDFYERSGSRKFDLILGNPPYIRYQYLEEC